MSKGEQAIEKLVADAAHDRSGQYRAELFEKLIGVELFYVANKKIVDSREMTSTPVRTLDDGSHAMCAYTSKLHPDLPRSFAGAKCPEIFQIATELVQADWLVIINQKNDMVPFSREQLQGMFAASQMPADKSTSDNPDGQRAADQLETVISNAVQTHSDDWHEPALALLRDREVFLHLTNSPNPETQPTMRTSRISGRDGWILTYTTRSRAGIRYAGITWENLVKLVHENAAIPGVQVVNDADDWIVLGRDAMAKEKFSNKQIHEAPEATTPRSTIWHKPLAIFEGQRLLANDVDPRLGGLPDVINGSVTPAMHIARLQGSAAYYEALGLNYAGSLFRPDQPLFSLRFTLADGASVQATGDPLARSIGKNEGADLGYASPPYMGNGFTAPGHAIAEYWIVGGVITRGELWHIPVQGKATLAGVLVGTNEWSAVRQSA